LAGGIVTGHEVAPASKLLESSLGESAVPFEAPSPALNANAMPRTPQTKKNETQTQRTGLRLPVKPATVAAAAIAGCTLVEGCTRSTPQVRPGPPAITCPEGWRETHKRFDLDTREDTATVVGFKGEPGELARVADGPATLQIGVFGGAGDLPDGTLLLGTWQLGEGRLFGTFNRAQIPGKGTIPVCLVTYLKTVTPFMDEQGKEYNCPRGLGTCLAPGSKPGNAKIATRVLLFPPAGQP
jgi:serine/threonine-protein kinase